MIRHRFLSSIGLSFAAASVSLAQAGKVEPESTPEITWPTLVEIARFSHEGAGSSAYDIATNMLFATGTKDIAMIHLGQGPDAALVRTLNPALESGLDAPDTATITSVVCDPRGRGVAMATVVPKDKATVPGRAVFFETRTGKTLASVTVGFDPVSALMTFGGGNVFIANRGAAAVSDRGLVIDPPGTVTWIGLDGFDDANAFRALDQSAVSTISPNGPLLTKTLPEMRIHPDMQATPSFDLEPTGLAMGGNWLCITFQANNCIGTFDLIKKQWRAFFPLGAIEQRIDACAQDGPNISDEFQTLPMPRDLAIMSSRGDMFIVTANAGAKRGRIDRDTDAAHPDAATLGWLALSKKVSEASTADGDLTYEGSGGLDISTFTGDVDGDGVIDHPSAFGSRSLSVWDVMSGQLLGDTGAAIEKHIAKHAPTFFNANHGRPDVGSLDYGPRPVSVVAVKVGRSRFAFTGLERPGAIAIVDVSTPSAPELSDILIAAEHGDTGLPTLTLIAAKDNPTGEDVLIAGYAGSGTVVIYRIVMP